MLPLRVRQVIGKALRAVGLYGRALALVEFLRPLEYKGTRRTWKRMLNLYVSRWQHGRRHTKLRAYPLLLTVEATNVCNLRCPGCFTGVEEQGREKSMISIDLYKKIMDELGDRLWYVEFYNWGESLLHKGIYDMIEIAHQRGISTNISTNFSIPFDAQKAERLVGAGLSSLGVSLDGATQDVYATYRRRGDLATVLKNVRLINDAKRKLGRQNPRLVWEFHVFQHNKHEIEQAAAMARELDMQIAVSKGWVAGMDWDPELSFEPERQGAPVPCAFLWQQAVINNDGGVAPCCGAFYSEDDFGRIPEPTVALKDMADSTFREIWNNDAFVQARQMFHDRKKLPAAARQSVCYACPATVSYEGYRAHKARGGEDASYDSGFSFNDGFNYFFNRRPESAGTNGLPGSDGFINLSAVTERPPREPIAP